MEESNVKSAVNLDLNFPDWSGMDSFPPHIPFHVLLENGYWNLPYRGANTEESEKRRLETKITERFRLD